MALPPLEDRLPLLNLNDSSEEELGYDCPVFVPDSGLSSPGSDSDYTNSGSSTEINTSSDDDDLDDLDDLDDPCLTYFSRIDPLVDNMKYILSMPDLCDVTFNVEPQGFPVHGLKAVIGSRSQVLREIIWQHTQKEPKKSKKTAKPGISITNYDIDVFKQFIYYVHTGSVKMDVTTVIGLLCASTEFDLPELSCACWGYLRHCARTSANIPVLKNEADNYIGQTVTKRIRQMLKEIQCDHDANTRKKETAV